MSQTARRARLLASVEGEFAYFSNEDFDRIPRVTTPVRQPNPRIWELFTKPEPLTDAEWAEWEGMCDERT